MVLSTFTASPRSGSPPTGVGSSSSEGCGKLAKDLTGGNATGEEDGNDDRSLSIDCSLTLFKEFEEVEFGKRRSSTPSPLDVIVVN